MKKKDNQIMTSNDNFARKWISYRSEIKVMDCTIRDGGLMNNHRFDPSIVRGVYQACVDAGVDYMEFGYKNSNKILSTDEYGPWKFTTEDDLRNIVGENETDLKISVMADVGRCDTEDILQKEQSVIDMIRVACYIHQIPAALDMVKDAHNKGYETTLNLMAVSTVQESEIDSALELISQSEVQVIYLVDSFGAMYSEQAHYLLRKYLQYCEPAGKMVGIHAHNNQQLAYANTIEAVVTGANYLDSSISGLGRGAGNCPTENLLGFLHNPKYSLRPIIKCIQENIEPLRETMRWGPDLPYLITGLLNQHPRAAMKHNAADDYKDLLKFFDDIQSED